MAGTQVETEAKKARILDAPYRALTIGIVLIVTTMAFEGLAITTIAPKLAQHLEGIHLYGWIFSAFLLSQIIGTMIMGSGLTGGESLAPLWRPSSFLLSALSSRHQRSICICSLPGERFKALARAPASLACITASRFAIRMRFGPKSLRLFPAPISFLH